MRTYQLGKEERRAIEELRERILKRFKDRIVLIKIFGSKIKGNAKKESDIDILIVYKGNDNIRNSLIDIEWKILKKYDYNIYLSVIPYSLGEYKNDYKIQTPFIYNVEKKGIDLWNTIRKKKY